MKLWRISNYADLDGLGGVRYAGRWHTPGRPVVYLAEHSALALLEIRVHFSLDIHDMPDSFQLLEVTADLDTNAILELSESVLEEQWRAHYSMTQPIGDEWLEQSSSVLLKVPSAIVPDAYNYLYNPRHHDASKVTITHVLKHPFDNRLFK